MCFEEALIGKRMNSAILLLLLLSFLTVSHGYVINGKEYEVQRMLGGGLSGIAYLVCDKAAIPEGCSSLPEDSPHWLVAKELYRQSPMEDYWRERFALKRTGRYITSTTNHTNRGMRVLVFKYTHGTRMDTVLWRVKGDPDKLEQMIDLYMQGLQRFHKRWDLIHNDPHPGNCVLQESGRVEFIDFGQSIDSAKLEPEERRANEQADFKRANFAIKQFLNDQQVY